MGKIKSWLVLIHALTAIGVVSNEIDTSNLIGEYEGLKLGGLQEKIKLIIDKDNIEIEFIDHNLKINKWVDKIKPPDAFKCHIIDRAEILCKQGKCTFKSIYPESMAYNKSVLCNNIDGYKPKATTHNILIFDKDYQVKIVNMFALFRRVENGKNKMLVFWSQQIGRPKIIGPPNLSIKLVEIDYTDQNSIDLYQVHFLQRK